MVPKLHCPTCGTDVRAHEKDCPSCASFCWFPNVRKAEEAEELKALEERYQAARAAAFGRDREPVFLAYESALADSVAVICRSLDQVKALLSSESAVYISFYRQRSSGGGRGGEKPTQTERGGKAAAGDGRKTRPSRRSGRQQMCGCFLPTTTRSSLLRCHSTGRVCCPMADAALS